jgi:hypothetical protein
VAVFIGRELGGWQKREMYFALDRQVRSYEKGRVFQAAMQHELGMT